MSSKQRKEPDWREYESYEDAARRLIGVMDERAKKRKTLAGGGLGTGQDSDQQPTRSLVGRAENGGQSLSAQTGPQRFEGSGRQQHLGEGGGAKDHAAGGVHGGSGIGKGGERADFSGGSFICRNKDTARPGALDEALVYRSRRYTDAPEDW